MDAVYRLAVADFEAFKQEHLLAPPLVSPLTLKFSASNWDWSELLNVASFKWNVGTSPLADLGFVVTTWIIYFSTIVLLKSWMKDRPAMKLKSLTAIHNLFLCLGSLAMWIAGAIGAYQTYRSRGWADVFWSPNPADRQGLQYWAMYVFYLSKFPELLDTVILVLKKKPVIFLHWYHHAIVILLVWTWMQAELGFGVVGLLFNTFVHIFMYYYYFASNLGWSVWYKKYITTLQIVQFIGSFLVSIPFVVAAVDNHCHSWTVLYFTWIVNFSFLVLFTKFYLESYKATSLRTSRKAANDRLVPKEE
ncbi:hypothetical protein HDV03_005402 [Kappamyces sp. JEL0829]|nr:hypothetical protein HDV03_005402 [Kappamyces sp. JEL0829]